MKFKVLFTILNIVLFSAFLVVFFLPVVVISREYFVEFWRGNWFLAVFFAGSIILVNTLFIRNWTVLTALEREDWPALAQHLEKQVLYRNKTGKRYVRLLFESLVLLGDFTALDKLATFLKSGNRVRYRQTVRGFAGAAVLSGNFRRVRVFCTDTLNEGNLDAGTSDWLSFYRGLARYLDPESAGAASDLAPLAREAPDPMVAALSAFLCSVILGKQDSPHCSVPREVLESSVQSARERLYASFTPVKWRTYLAEASKELEIVILGKLPGQASAWLFPEQGF